MNGSISRTMLLRAGAALLAYLAAGQQATAQSQMTVEVSFVATGKANAPVQDLTANDITIKDDNKKQLIVSMEKVVAGAPVAPGKPRLYNVVLLDCMNTTFRDVPENRAEMLRVLNELSKADNLTFLVLWRKLHVLQDASMQPPTLVSKLASQGLQGLEGARPNLEPYNWVFSDQLGLFQLFTPAGINDQRLVEESVGAMRIISSTYLNRPGRKNLIWITQGLPITGEQTAAGMTVYPIDSRYLSTGALSIDENEAPEHSNMQAMAKATGGLAFLSRKDVANCVRDALNDSRTTYVVKYTTSDLKYDGKSHLTKIETSRPGIKLRYGAQYHAAQ
jgi:VWFA-related protein